MALILTILGITLLVIWAGSANIAFLILSILLLGLIASRLYGLYKQKAQNDKLKNALIITNVGKGGVFTLRGVGENSEDLTLNVLAKHLYQQGDYYWIELECDKGDGDKVFVDVENDDYVEVSVVLEELKLSDIDLSNSLEKIDDDEAGFARYKGQRFGYKESDKAIFYRFSDDKNREDFYYWDFRDFIDKNYSISVEKWGNKEYKVYYSQIILPSQVTVLKNGGEK